MSKRKINLSLKGKITKPVGIAIFTTVMLLMALIIVLYHNPLADPMQEMIKKIIACVIIVIAIVVFSLLYDKITVLPVELYQSRHLIWKLARNDFKKRMQVPILALSGRWCSRLLR